MTMVSWECNHSSTHAVGGISSSFPARSLLSPSSCWQTLLRYSSPGRSPSFVEVGAGWAPLGRAVTAELSPHPRIKFRGTGDSPSSAPAPELRSSHAAPRRKSWRCSRRCSLRPWTYTCSGTGEGSGTTPEPRLQPPRDTREERLTQRRRQAAAALGHCPGTAKGRAPPGTRVLPPPPPGSPGGAGSGAERPSRRHPRRGPRVPPTPGPPGRRPRPRCCSSSPWRARPRLRHGPAARSRERRVSPVT